MDISIQEIVTILISIFSVGSYIWLSASRIAKLELKVDTIWDFLMKRALGEAISKGIATMNSPIIFSQITRQLMSPIEKDLKDLRKKNKKLKRVDFQLLIERTFGDWLLSNVCIPNGFDKGACLSIAYDVANEENNPPN